MTRVLIWLLYGSLVAGCRSPGSEGHPQFVSPPPGDPQSSRAGAPPALSEAEVVPSLSLGQALERAWTHDARLDALQAQIQTWEARSRQAGRWPNPNLVIGTEAFPLEGRTFHRAEYLLGLNQRIPLGDRRPLAAKEASLSAAQTEQRLRQALRDLRREVQGAFATALYAQEATRKQEELLALAKLESEIARGRVAAGDQVPADAMPAELVLLEAQRELRQANALRDLAMARLTATLSQPGLRIERLAGDLNESLALPPLRTLVDELARHPGLQASQLQTEIAETRIALAEAQRIPQVQVSLLYRRQEASDTDAIDAGLQIPLPLFNSGAEAIEAARSERRAAIAQYERARRETESGVRLAHRRLEQALAHWNFLESEIVPRLESWERTAEARHAAGDLALAELLPVQRSRVSQQLGALEARREVFVAWAELSPYLADK